MRKQAVRIVGGDYRRTPISVVDAPGLRPTPDRVRETLFNWLNHFWYGQFSDKNVLDLFAGSGALGFEAASRGVAFVQMVEQHGPAVANLRALRTKLKAEHIRIHAGDALHILERSQMRYDLVFIDPPFARDWMDRIWPLLPNVLAPDALVYIESETPIQAPDQYGILRQDKAGQVHYHLLRFAAMQKTVNNAEFSGTPAPLPPDSDLPT